LIKTCCRSFPVIDIGVFSYLFFARMDRIPFPSPLRQRACVSVFFFRVFCIGAFPLELHHVFFLLFPEDVADAVSLFFPGSSQQIWTPLPFHSASAGSQRLVTVNGQLAGIPFVSKHMFALFGSIPPFAPWDCDSPCLNRLSYSLFPFLREIRSVFFPLPRGLLPPPAEPQIPMALTIVPFLQKNQNRCSLFFLWPASCPIDLSFPPNLWCPRFPPLPQKQNVASPSPNC